MKYVPNEYEYEFWLHDNTEKYGARFESLRRDYAQAKMAHDDHRANKLWTELVDMHSELSDLGLGIYTRYKEGKDYFLLEIWFVIYLVGFIAAIVIVISILIAYLFDLHKRGEFDFALDFLFLTLSGKIALTLIVSGVGYTLFLFKKKKQFYYGVVETSFAVANCYLLADNFQAIIAKHNDISNILFSGMATLYLMVRGLSNISDGIDKSPKPLFLFWYEIPTKATKRRSDQAIA